MIKRRIQSGSERLKKLAQRDNIFYTEQQYTLARMVYIPEAREQEKDYGWEEVTFIA